MPDALDEKLVNQDYTLEKPDKLSKKQEESRKETPVFTLTPNLTQEQKDRLVKEIFSKFENLKNERKELGLEQIWQESENIYDGTVQKNSLLRFNLHSPQAKVKIDAITRAASTAFSEQDPKYSITPRPDFAGKNGMEVTTRQEDFLDFAFDEEIKGEEEEKQCIHEGLVKYVSLLKLNYEYKVQLRKRDEVYQGTKDIVGVDDLTGKPIVLNKGLKRFLENYPDAIQRYPGLVRKLIELKEVKVVARYFDNVANNPTEKCVKPENFYVKNSTKTRGGLTVADLTIERFDMTWRELKSEEEKGNFEGVDQLKLSGSKLKEDSEKIGVGTEMNDFEFKDYNILECNYMFKMNEDDDEKDAVKLKVFLSEERESFLGAIYFPYYLFDVDYLPIVPKPNGKGFYGGGMGVIRDLKDSNIAQNAMLNFMLQAAFNKNMITPIVKEGSEIEAQFAEKRWTHGVPLTINEDAQDIRSELDFVDWPNVNINDFIAAIQFLKRQDGDVSGVSDLTTGAESLLDPNAPGNKTIALLQVSGINIKEYISNMAPAFNELGTMVLQLYYQMSNEDKRFRVKRKGQRVSGKAEDGSDLFDTITRDEMIARTNVQSRATIFAFDKLQEKNENLAMYQVWMNNPMVLNQPKAMHQALRILSKSWSPTWKNQFDQILNSPEDFQRQQFELVLAATAQYFQALNQQRNNNQPVNANIEDLTAIVQQAQLALFRINKNDNKS